MNSKFKIIIFTLVALVAFSMAACTASAQTINSPEALKEYLDKQPSNTPDKPIRISMAANDLMLPKIAAVLRDTGKYVSLSLSGNALTSIPDFAFFDMGTEEGCITLTAIVIPNSVTSIGMGAFAMCTSLASVTIPNSVKSIGVAAFAECTSLANVTIPNSVTSIEDRAFYECTSLASVAIPNSVTSIGVAAFSECTSLISVTIPNSVTSIGISAFAFCTKLTSITVGSGNPNYASEGGILYNKAKTEIVEVPKGISGNITIPNSITSIEDYAFLQCSNLVSVTIPDSVTSIGGNAFQQCTSLASVTIPDSVTSIGEGAFGKCTSLAAINVNSGNRLYSSDNGVLYNKDKTILIQFPGGKTGAFTIPDSVTRFGKEAFNACINLTSVTIPNSVTSIGSWLFTGCRSLTSVTIPNSVTSIGDGAFASCPSLASITIPNRVTSIGERAFSSCTSLTSVKFEGTIASRNLDNWAFGVGTGGYSGYLGDLRSKYLAGGIGTYTRPNVESTTWTKQ